MHPEAGHGEEPVPWIRYTKDSQPLPLDSPVHSLQPVNLADELRPSDSLDWSQSMMHRPPGSLITWPSVHAASSLAQRRSQHRPA
ncbi:unnamed protein product [Caretta caretta]